MVLGVAPTGQGIGDNPRKFYDISPSRCRIQVATVSGMVPIYLNHHVAAEALGSDKGGGNEGFH